METKEVTAKVKRVTRISFKDKKKEGQFVLRSHERKDGSYFELKDRHGNDASFTLRMTTFFNLDNEFEAKVVEGFRNHPTYARFIDIVNMDEEAAKSTSKFQLKLEAGNVINDLGEMLLSFARALNLNTVGLSETRVLGQLHQIADSDPSRILKAYRDPALQLRMMVFDGREAGLFKEENGVWFYNNQPMGNNAEQAITWLEKHKDLRGGLKREIAEKLSKK